MRSLTRYLVAQSDLHYKLVCWGRNGLQYMQMQFVGQRTLEIFDHFRINVLIMKIEIFACRSLVLSKILQLYFILCSHCFIKHLVTFFVCFVQNFSYRLAVKPVF